MSAALKRLTVLTGCGVFWAVIVWIVWAVATAQTREEMRTIEIVNQAVNASIRPRPDFPGHLYIQQGPDDEPTEGDCDDYARAKYLRLIALGFAASRLELATVRTETGEPHAVLIVDGDIVLDNRFPWTQSREGLIRFRYRFED